MDIEVHRAGRTFYAHTAVLLYTPRRQFDTFFNLSEWPLVVAAKFLEFPEVSGRPLTDFSPSGLSTNTDAEVGLTGNELEALLRRQIAGELNAEQLIQEMRILRERKIEQARASNPSALAQLVVERTGVPVGLWERAGHVLLESVLPTEGGRTDEIFDQENRAEEAGLARSIGFSSIMLAREFPVITAAYGYSRAEYSPQECWLNPFPPERQEGGKLPIFVDQVQADALLIRLDEHRIARWLESNGLIPAVPKGRDAILSIRAYPVRLFDDAPMYQTLQASRAEARLVFGLLHTLSHLCVRRAALLCGLDHTSLSEYLLPQSLTFAIYCNHRFGATIGALTALFEQSLSDWLRAVRDSTRCVYDPVCGDSVGSCHACTHLAETSCRFFNLNLNRAFLFGGQDPVLGSVRVGYLDGSLSR